MVDWYNYCSKRAEQFHKTIHWTWLDPNVPKEERVGKAGTKFSGEFDFVETAYIYPITHMVALKDKSLSCSECHSKTDSRLANLKGFYMPGRDASKIIDLTGWGVALACLMGVLIHALGRIFTRSNGRKEK